MKILVKGTPPGERVHQATCQRCKSVIEFEQGEAKISTDPRDGISLMVIDCPVCEGSIYKDLK